MPRLKNKKGCFKCENHASMIGIDVCNQNTTSCDSNLKNSITWASDEISLATFFPKKTPTSGGRIKNYHIDLPGKQGTIPLYCRLLKNETFKKEISKIQIEGRDVAALQVLKGSLFDGKCIVFLKDGWIVSILLSPQDRGEKNLKIDTRYENQAILGAIRIKSLNSKLNKKSYEIELQLFAGNAHYQKVLKESTLRIGRLNNYIDNNNFISLNVIQSRKNKIINKKAWNFFINKNNIQFEDTHTVSSNNSNNSNNSNSSNNNSRSFNFIDDNDIYDENKARIMSLENSLIHLQRELMAKERIILKQNEQINLLTNQLSNHNNYNSYTIPPLQYNNNNNNIINNNGNNEENSSNDKLSMSHDTDIYEYNDSSNQSMFPVDNMMDIEMNHNNNGFNVSMNSMTVNFSTSNINTRIPMKRSREPDFFDETMSLYKDPFEQEINMEQINIYPSKKQNTGNIDNNNNFDFPFPS